ncbi:LPXTG cell wall anchor domain-containing protein [Clostridium sp. B9]|uniref:LPXTG cell wall anchor domain-containing protein n=1 Tax=Clostridium sp. B9 TaxID=3423224 RepID=UPI003D2EC4DA
MKKVMKSFLFTMAFLLIICNQGGANVFAAPNVKLEGNADGIVFIPGDGPFLSSMNMLPGDKVERNIILKNRSDVPYKVFMRAERQTKEEKYDLLKKIDLSIDYEKSHVYDGPITGENGLTENICLGVVNPEETKVLEAIAQLDGKATGNEYKNKNGRVDWIFTAVKLNNGIDKKEANDENTKEYSKKVDKGYSIDNKDIKNEEGIPYTGDNGVEEYVAILLISLIALLILNRNFKLNK